MKIGLIADTHGLLRDEALDYLTGHDLIIHAGDVGKPEVLERLARVAPVHAVRGNVDRGEWAAHLPETAVVEAGVIRVLVLHDRNELTVDPEAEGYGVVVAGHSHQPLVRRDGNVLHVNPGSAGPRRFSLPVSVGTLEVNGGEVTARTVTLDVAPAQRRVR